MTCSECTARQASLAASEQLLERKWRELRHLPQPEYNRLRQPAVDQLKTARANLERHMAECTEEKR